MRSLRLFVAGLLVVPATSSAARPAPPPTPAPSPFFGNQSALLGTWTLQTHATSDLGYYKGSAFLVMHVMADPLRAYGCSLPDCDEYHNEICQLDETQDKTCADMASAVSEWSDVSVFFQYGFQLESGTYPWRSKIFRNTSDWVGPYNLVLPVWSGGPTVHEIHGRYVATPSTDFLRKPANDTLFDDLFDVLGGGTAVRATTAQQADKNLYHHPREDPFAGYQGKCGPNGAGIRPELPLFVASHQNLVLEHRVWSLPTPGFDDKDSLSKLWPALQKHLPGFPVVGPYCYGGDPQRAYAIHVAYDTRIRENNTWHLTDGCVYGLPCWPDEPSPDRPSGDDGGGGGGGGGGDDDDDNHNGGTAATIYRLVVAYGAYFLLLALVISLTLNCQLSFRLQRLGELLHEAPQHRRRRPPPPAGEEGGNDLEQPLLLPSEEAGAAEAPPQDDDENEEASPPPPEPAESATNS